ncbi:TrkA family potassium uptake protein [Bacillota bacterium LX-D]|nr:TrkA family potassium uptake protein [Bacillota bacterium LX-D]
MAYFMTNKNIKKPEKDNMEKRNAPKRTIDFGVIGLGRFGLSLVDNLAKAGKELLVIDNDENKIKHLPENITHAVIADTHDIQALREAGIQNCDVVVVCIGEDKESSILTTLNVLDLGVPTVIAKAISPEHGKVLTKIGAEVVYPEKDMGIRLANSLLTSKIVNYFEISEDYSIVEIRLSSKFAGKTIEGLNIRKKFKLNVLTVVKGKQVIVEIAPDLVLEENDIIVVVGHNDNIALFQRQNAKE